MKLHTREWGGGERVAVLIHGMMGDSRQFWEVGPRLVQRGFRAIAVDLPGHGLSGPCLAGGLPAFADAVSSSVPSRPSLAIGHSLGAMVLAGALTTMRPERAVYVDVPFAPIDLSPESPNEPANADALTQAFHEAKGRRTADRLAQSRPWWNDGDIEAEVEAAKRFHVPTAVALELDATTGGTTEPPPTTIPSLLIHAEPSAYVSAERAEELRHLGFAVRGIEGAGHSVWYGFADEFMEALDAWVKVEGGTSIQAGGH